MVLLSRSHNIVARRFEPHRDQLEEVRIIVDDQYFS